MIFLCVFTLIIREFLKVTVKSTVYITVYQQKYNTGIFTVFCRECCIPILGKLFEVNDRHVRLILLQYFHLYVGMFDKNVLQSVILPEVSWVLFQIVCFFKYSQVCVTSHTLRSKKIKQYLCLQEVILCTEQKKKIYYQ